MAFSNLPIRLRLYLIAHVAAGLPALSVLSQLPPPTNLPLAVSLLVLTALVATWKVELTAFQGRMTPVFALVCLAMLLQGAQAAVACAAVGALVTTVIRSPQGRWKVQFQRQALHQMLFNPIHCGIVCLLAALTYRVVRMVGPQEEWGRIVALSAFTAVYFAFNSAGISLAIAFKQGVKPLAVWKEHFLWTSPNFFVSALAAAVVWWAFHAVGAWALLLITPLYLVYYSYWLYLDRLRQANVDLKTQIADRERAEGELRQEREFLQAVLENAGDAIIACDARGVPTHVNRAARDFLDRESLEAPIAEWGRRLGISLPGPAARGEVGGVLGRAMTREGIHNVELVWPAVDGGMRTVLVSGQSIAAAVGKRLGGILVIHDISDRRRADQEHAEAQREHAARAEAEDARQRSAFLAEATGVLSASLDYGARLADLARVAVPFLADGCLVEIVQDDGELSCLAAAHVDPVREELLLSQPRAPLAELSADHPVRRALVYGRPEAYPQDFRSGRAPASAQLFLGHLRAESFICVPLVAQGNTLGVLTFFRTTTGVPYEQVHIDLAADLARRAALMIENARLYQQAQEHDRRKNEFLAMLAHELRNPLAPILNAIAVMRLRSADDPPTQRLREIVERQTRHLARLVDDLLDISRITRGTVELKSAMVRLDQVVESAVQTSLPHVRNRCHALDVRLPKELVWLDADATRLSQVLANLLNNAAKYTDPGGSIALEARLQPGGAQSTDDPWVEISVRDNGRGIPPEMVLQIFDLFTQVDTTLDRSLGGLGIGLTLVKQLVEMHGGTVSALSEGPGHGAEFIVRLPVAEVEKPEGKDGLPARDGVSPLSSAPLPSRRAAAKNGVPAGVRRPGPATRVLLVEDNADAAEVLTELLELWGHEVFHAEDGEVALTLAMDQSLDVVVLDIGLPGMSGYEVARRMRSQGSAPHAPLLIALTGYGGEEDRRRAQEAGFDHHLTKPVDPEALQRLLALPRVSMSR